MSVVKTRTLGEDSTGEGAAAVHGGALHTFLPTHTPMASPERRKPQRSAACTRPLLPRGGPSAESDKGHFAAVNGPLSTLYTPQTRKPAAFAGAHVPMSDAVG